MKRIFALQLAKALFSSTDCLQQLSVWKASLKAFLDLLEQDFHLKTLFASPQLSNKEKEDLLHNCYKGPKDPKLLNFIKYLIKQHKLSYLKLIVEEFFRLFNEKAHVLQALLIVAFPIDPKLLRVLKEKLKNSTSKNVSIEVYLQPSIIGGGILLFENRRWDFSIQNRLSQMKRTLLAKIR